MKLPAASDGEVSRLSAQVTDARGKRVLFVSHCILNANVRYLGGAFDRACVAPIVERAIADGVGLVQMPCPEEQAWGGVAKRTFLWSWGRHSLRSAGVRRIVLRIFVARTRRVYRRLAREVAARIEDYVRSGIVVTGVVGVDASPSCGVRTKVDMKRALPMFAELDVASASADDVNAIVRGATVEGAGIFTRALRRELARRSIDVPFFAHAPGP